MKTSIEETIFQILVGRTETKKYGRRRINEQEVHQILRHGRNLLRNEPFMLELSGEIVIVGDLHGNIDDLIRIFEKMKYPPQTRYLFLGDYVDRGNFSCEVMILLIALKVLYPTCVYLLRGNHETYSLSQNYGFFDEVCSKFNETIYEEFVDTFQLLPLCAVVGNRIFCVHGGISPKMTKLKHLRTLSKPSEINGDSVYSDLVWSDPSDDVHYFEPSNRGRGYLYGSAALTEFLDENQLDLVVRSHETCNTGVLWPFINNPKTNDKCITIFSSTDYCQSGNNAAVLRVSQTLSIYIEFFHSLSQKEKQSKEVAFPYWLNGFAKSQEKSYNFVPQNIYTASHLRRKRSRSHHHH